MAVAMLAMSWLYHGCSQRESYEEEPGNNALKSHTNHHQLQSLLSLDYGTSEAPHSVVSGCFDVHVY